MLTFQDETCCFDVFDLNSKLHVFFYKAVNWKLCIFLLKRFLFRFCCCGLLCRWFGVVSGWEHSFFSKCFCFGSKPNCITLLLLGHWCSFSFFLLNVPSKILSEAKCFFFYLPKCFPTITAKKIFLTRVGCWHLVRFVAMSVLLNTLKTVNYDGKMISCDAWAAQSPCVSLAFAAN